MGTTPDPIDVYVGQRIRGRRLELGQTQLALAQALGMSFQQVQKYEKGSNRISASVLQHAAQAQGVAPGFYFEAALGDEAQAPDLDARRARHWLSTREAWAFAEVIPQLSRPDRGALLKFVRSLVESQR